MATNAQIQANRNNAKKSTGPKTSAGKTRVSQNATKHGMLTRYLIWDTGDGAQDPQEMTAFIQAVRDELEPKGAVEETLVEDFIRCAVQLQNATQAEAGANRLNTDSYKYTYRQRAETQLRGQISELMDESFEVVPGTVDEDKSEILCQLRDSSGGTGWLIDFLNGLEASISRQGGQQVSVTPLQFDSSPLAQEICDLLTRKTSRQTDDSLVAPVLKCIQNLKKELKVLQVQAEKREAMEVEAQLMCRSLPDDATLGNNQRYTTAARRGRDRALETLYKLQDRRKVQEREMRAAQ